jgi:hypothetical protein
VVTNLIRLSINWRRKAISVPGPVREAVALLHKVMEWASETEAWREGGGGREMGKRKWIQQKSKSTIYHTLTHTPPRK